MPSLADRVTTPPASGSAMALPLLMRLGDGFVPARARGARATIEWRVQTSAGVERVWMQVDDGAWLVTRDQLEPSLTITLGLADLALLLEGRASATRLFLAQRVQLTGDVLLAVRLPDFFGLTPRREPEPRPARRTRPVGPRGS